MFVSHSEVNKTTSSICGSLLAEW